MTQVKSRISSELIPAYYFEGSPLYDMCTIVANTTKTKTIENIQSRVYDIWYKCSINNSTFYIQYYNGMLCYIYLYVCQFDTNGNRVYVTEEIKKYLESKLTHKLSRWSF